MANAQVLYAESLTGSANSTAWVDLASIPAASFTANKTYLIIANQVSTTSSATNDIRARLVHGTTPTVFDDASLAIETPGSADYHELSFMFLFTQPGTTELVKLQISNSSTSTVTNILSQIIAIKLSDDFTSGTDYFWNEDLTNYTITSTPTAKATTASFTPNGTDKWLYIGHMIHDVVSITDEIGFELYDSVAGVLGLVWVEGEDATNEFIGSNIYWVGTPTNAARTVAVRPVNEGGSNVMLASRVIAINLAKFAQVAATFDAAEVDPATAPTYTTVATVSFTPTNTGDWVYIGFAALDQNETGTDFRARIQANPDGGGLVSNPNFNSAAPGIDIWDALDETQFSVFKLLQFNSGASRTVNYDFTQGAGTTGRVEDIGLVAFSVELAAAGTNFTRSVSDTTGITDAITKITGFFRTIATTEANTMTITKVGTYIRALTTTEANTDSLTKITGFFRSKADSVGITDVVARTVGKLAAIADNVGITDLISNIRALVRSESDTTGITDSFSRNIGYFRTLLDTHANSDVLSKVGTYIRSISNTTGITDVLSAFKIILRSILDSVGITDSLSKVRALVRSISDTTGITDTLSRIASFARSLTNTVGITDSIVRVLSFARAVADTLGITDVLSYILNGGGANLVRSISDTVGITDVLSKIAQYKRTLLDTESYTDSLTRLTNYFRAISNTESITDITSRTAGKFIQILDTLSYTDVVSSIKFVVISILNTVGITDSLSRAGAFTRSISNQVSITDLLSKIQTLIRSINDSLGITDFITAAKNVIHTMVKRYLRGTINSNAQINGSIHSRAILRGKLDKSDNDIEGKFGS